MHNDDVSIVGFLLQPDTILSKGNTLSMSQLSMSFQECSLLLLLWCVLIGILTSKEGVLLLAVGACSWVVHMWISSLASTEAMISDDVVVAVNTVP